MRPLIDAVIEGRWPHATVQIGETFVMTATVRVIGAEEDLVDSTARNSAPTYLTGERTVHLLITNAEFDQPEGVGP